MYIYLHTIRVQIKTGEGRKEGKKETNKQTKKERKTDRKDRKSLKEGGKLESQKENG